MKWINMKNHQYTMHFRHKQWYTRREMVFRVLVGDTSKPRAYIHEDI